MKTIKRLSLSEQVVRSIVQYVQENNLSREISFLQKMNLQRALVSVGQVYERRSKHLESTEC